MTVSLAELKSMGFNPSHKIMLPEDASLRFEKLKGASVSTEPAVYMWVAHADGADQGEILYVGKAGRGIERRCAQHQGGFTGSSTGRKNAAALTEILSASAITVTVMARQSDTTELFGQTVSLYSTEEDALCARFAPRLNRAAFPEISGRQQALPDPVASIVQQPKQIPLQVDAQPVASEDAPSRIFALINNRLKVQDEGTVDDMIGQVEAYGPQELARLEGLLEVVETRLLAPEHALKLIGGYTRQPKDCNGITTLGFGRLVERNFAPNGWVARIYMTAAPRVSFPLNMLKPDARDLVEANEKLFAPLAIDSFLRDPGAFIQRDYLR